MTDTAALAVGDRFTMAKDTEPVELLDNGRHLATFLPGFVYRVTGKNLEMATKLIAEGKATKGGTSLPQRLAKAGLAVGAASGDVVAKVRVKPKKK